MLERDLYLQVARYIQVQYPDVIYRFDLAADIKLTVGQAAKHKRLHPYRGYPDLFLAQPAQRSSEYPDACYKFGLFIELKKEGTRLKKRNGEWASEHIAEQARILEMLELRGYAAKFAVGFDEARKLIDEYLHS